MAETETFTPVVKSIILRCDAIEVPRARRAIRYNLRDGYPESVSDAVEQCASECVTNAIVHSDSKEKGGTVMLVIVAMEDRVRVEVIDDGSAEKEPELIDDADDEEYESGRGLCIVNELSSAWGTYVDESGRNVWFEVNIY